MRHPGRGGTVERMGDDIRARGTVLAAWTGTLLRALDARGIDGVDLAREAGVTTDQLADPDHRVPIAASSRLWALAVEATGDPALGLDVSCHVLPTTFHALGQAFLASATLHDALERTARYCRVTSDVADVATEVKGSDVTLQIGWRTGATRPADEALDAVLSAIVRGARTLLGRELAPTQLALERPHPGTDAAARFDRMFRCPVRFGGSVIRLTFDRTDAERPVPGGNDTLARSIDEVLRRYVSGLDRSTVAEQVRQAVVPLLASGEPRIGDVARSINLSTRSLQRGLAAEQTTFRDVLAEVRRELAEQYLRGGTSVTETTYLVGFSETAAFSRAFKRWTGSAPSSVVHQRIRS
jgi:AraC-like DNA-binding protein